MSGAAAQAVDVFRRGRARFSARTISIAGFVVYAVATVILINSDGILLSRDVVFGWILIGMLAVSLADLRGWARGVIFDWLPFFALLFAYDFLRGLVGSSPLFPPHVLPQIDADKFLFGSVPTVDLQAHFLNPNHIDWLDVTAWAVYVSHFFTVFVIAATLWRLARPRFLEFRAMVLTLTAAAFTTYALFPAAPPWMASEDGVIGPVDRIVGDVWRYLGVGSAASIWDHGSALSNQVAALPSLHAAYPVLILCFFWSTNALARVICLVYAVAMGLALIYTGEHYVFDILLGWVYAITTYLVVIRVRKGLAARRLRRGDLLGLPNDPDSLSGRGSGTARQNEEAVL
ncbi:MAG: phosphatase PAP2 family protein [Solirubrobacterales bacterium]|nr:phosphatase PAP2 family protein [Solirubrobacterales bacterium]